MIHERLNSSYKNHLLAEELSILDDSISGSPLTSTKIPSLSFDERVNVFKNLSKSTLFHHSEIFNDDVEFWFPECFHLYKHDIKKVISKSDIETSLECVIAELMES